MDEEIQALNDTSEVNTLDDSPTPEQTTEEVSEPTDEAAAESKSEEAETEDNPKKGYQSRIRELNQRAKQAEQKAKSLADKLAELTGSVDSGGYQPQYTPQQQLSEPIVQPGEEIDALELDRRIRVREQSILQQADARAELRQKQTEALNRINSEAQKALAKYPELDPESDSFNKDLSDSITEAAEGYIRSNPYTASVEKYVDRLMKPFKGAVVKQVGEATENIAKQVSEAALRPTSIRKKEKTAQEKSIAELEAELGIVQA